MPRFAAGVAVRQTVGAGNLLKLDRGGTHVIRTREGGHSRRFWRPRSKRPFALRLCSSHRVPDQWLSPSIRRGRSPQSRPIWPNTLIWVMVPVWTWLRRNGYQRRCSGFHLSD